MESYLITYNKKKTIKVAAINADHARSTLTRVIPGVLEINSTIRIRKDGQLTGHNTKS